MIVFGILFVFVIVTGLSLRFFWSQFVDPEIRRLNRLVYDSKGITHPDWIKIENKDQRLKEEIQRVDFKLTKEIKDLRGLVLDKGKLKKYLEMKEKEKIWQQSWEEYWKDYGEAK